MKSQLTNQYKLQEQTNSKHEREIKNLSRQLFQTREQKNKLETKLESQKEQFQKQPTKERVSPVETI